MPVEIGTFLCNLVVWSGFVKKSVVSFTLVQIIAVWCGLARFSACCCTVVMSLVRFDLSMLQLKNHLLLVKLSVVMSSRS